MTGGGGGVHAPLRPFGTLQIKPPSLHSGTAGVEGHGGRPVATLPFLRVSELTDDKIRKTAEVIYQEGGGVLQCLSLLQSK